MLRLEITPQENGTLDVRGILSDDLQIRNGNSDAEDERDFCACGTTSARRPANTETERVAVPWVAD
jgi:hypothetical protein